MSSNRSPRSCLQATIEFLRENRQTVSTVTYFGAIALALPGVVKRFMSEGPVIPSVWLLVCDIIWLVIFLLFGCINVLFIDNFKIVEIGGYVASMFLTTMISRWYLEIPDNQLFVYLPALVDGGIFIAAVGIEIANMEEAQRRNLVEGLKNFRGLVANLLPAALVPTGGPGN